MSPEVAQSAETVEITWHLHFTSYVRSAPKSGQLKNTLTCRYRNWVHKNPHTFVFCICFLHVWCCYRCLTKTTSSFPRKCFQGLFNRHLHIPHFLVTVRLHLLGLRITHTHIRSHTDIRWDPSKLIPGPYPSSPNGEGVATSHKIPK